jgi:hypothetical protein
VPQPQNPCLLPLGFAPSVTLIRRRPSSPTSLFSLAWCARVANCDRPRHHCRRRRTPVLIRSHAESSVARQVFPRGSTCARPVLVQATIHCRDKTRHPTRQSSIVRGDYCALLARRPATCPHLGAGRTLRVFDHPVTGSLRPTA